MAQAQTPCSPPGSDHTGLCDVSFLRYPFLFHEPNWRKMYYRQLKKGILMYKPTVQNLIKKLTLKPLAVKAS